MSYLDKVQVGSTTYDIQDTKAQDFNKDINPYLRNLVSDSGVEMISENMMELGNITFTGDAPYTEQSLVYTTSGSAHNQRVRTKQGVLFKLYPGDVIGLTDYSSAEFGVLSFRPSGAKSDSGWKQEEYKILQTSYAVMYVRNNPASSLANDPERQKELRRLIYIRRAESTRKQMMFTGSNSNVRAVCHRGFTVDGAPENTLFSFAAAKQRGFEYVETDISFTSDCVPVLLHDTTINRTARNADGTELDEPVNIYDISYEALQEYDFGIASGPEYAGLKICTFEDCVKFCKWAGIKIWAELKTNGSSGGDGMEANVKTCTDLVKKYGMDKSVTWISYSPALLGCVKNELPKARLGLLIATKLDRTSENTTVSLANGLKTGTNEVFVDMQNGGNGALAEPTDADILRAEGIGLAVFTIDTPGNLSRVDGYATDITTNLLDVDAINWQNIQTMLTI